MSATTYRRTPSSVAAPASDSISATMGAVSLDTPSLDSVWTADTPSQTSSASTSDAESMKPQRVKLASLRTNTMFEPRDAANQNRNRPPKEWTVPKVTNRHGRTMRAATLFLGKDHERWQQYERERMDASGSAGLRVAWRAGTSSTIQVGSALEWESEDDEDDAATTAYSSDTGSEAALSFGEGSSSRGDSRRSSIRRRSSSRGSKSHSTKGFPRVVQSGRRESVAEVNSPSSTYSFDGTPSSKGSRPRRFSSNGPEAAFLRHETVIGIHNPRRDSQSSNYERIALAPLSQIKMPPAGTGSSISSTPVKSASPNRRHMVKNMSSSDMLAQAAEAAAAAVSKRRRDERSVSGSTTGLTDDEDAQAAMFPGLKAATLARKRSASPSKALKLAPRRKPIRVDGTLYDRSGPFREGAVTDGLCVRFFSSDDVSEPLPPPPSSSRSKRHHHDMHHDKPTVDFSASTDTAVADEEMVPTTYLITTPDNRVSSAAKLRRWAMDGEGHFYAAMEIKSVEAKMRAADPSLTNGGGISKSLMRELHKRFMSDLLDEVQKAETLNPGREAVAHVICTSDNKYLRLEEDYPEEAFFVIAGCDEEELKPVVSLVFAHALRAIVGFHSAGWLHGDIKLENLMFDEQGRLVVIDYENANPFRGIPGGDGRVTLVSYDWVPPEAFPGPHGRRAGPSADLWALGCNVIRAFALRDNVEDVDIREALLGKGQQAFLHYRRTTLLRKRGSPARRGSDVGIPGSHTRPLPTAADVDLSSLLLQEQGQEEADATTQDGDEQAHGPPPPGPLPQRLLGRFAREAPELLKIVIARCVSDLPEERSVEAEAECMQYADELAREQVQNGESSLLSVGKRAVMTAINLSGSSWVRPKLDEARRTLSEDAGTADAEE